MTKRSLADEKTRLRRTMEASLRSVSRDDARRMGEVVADRLTAWSGWEAVKTVAFYAAIRGEVDTTPLFRAAQRASKSLLFPRMCEGDSLEFALVEDLGMLRPGRYGVLEPDETCPVQAIAEHTLVLVPGLAFDRAGGRLGRGAGYYDRALGAEGERDHRARRIGVAFARQVVEAVPMTSLDVRMDFVVTEAGFFATEPPGAESRKDASGSARTESDRGREKEE